MFDHAFLVICWLMFMKVEEMLVSLLKDIQSRLPEGVELCDLVKEEVEPTVEGNEDIETSDVEDAEDTDAAEEEQQKEKIVSLEETEKVQVHVECMQFVQIH
jgi:hypothetical protein